MSSRAVLPVVACALALAACDDDDATGPPLPPAPELPVQAPAQFQACVTGSSAAGALFEVCLPATWNGELVLWAHGYVNPGPGRAPFTPLELPDDEASGVTLKDIVRSLGTAQEGFYGYASTSYRRNGLVAAEAVSDLEDLAAWAESQLQTFAAQEGFDGFPVWAFLVGASEGGLSTVLAIEDARSVDAFDGGLALCGPIGNFRSQIDWFGDFRVVFDYFFPGIMPGNAIQVPDEDSVITDGNWAQVTASIAAALEAQLLTASELVAVTGLPVDPADPGSLPDVATEVLRYSFFGTNDATDILDGNPYGNENRQYSGSTEDAALNAGVDRFTPAALALATIEALYETTGRLRVPLVAMHTLDDPVTPFWHETLYQAKATAAGSESSLVTIPVAGYRHCGFSLSELLAGFSQLVLQVKGQNLVTSSAVFPEPAQEREFLQLSRRHGAWPVVERD